MASDTTVPSRTLRRLGRVLSSATGLDSLALGCLRLGRGRDGLGAAQLGIGNGQLAFAQHRVDAGDVAPHLSEAAVVVELAGDVLEAQVEQLLFGLGQMGQELGVVHLAQLDGIHRTSSERVMNLAFIGSFWIARSIASRANVSLTPASSNMTRPGLTTATQCSGLPLPD